MDKKLLKDLEHILNIWGFPKIRGTILGPNSKDSRIVGSIFGSPYFGKLPYNPP